MLEVFGVDVEVVSSAVALIAATGAVSGMSESAALGMVGRVRERIRVAFGGDPRSEDALDRALEEPGNEDRVRELAAALVWYARQDETFRDELAGWGREMAPAGSVKQTVRAGRDAYTAGRDLTVQQHAEGRADERE
ncbi:MAG: hypothetical protein ABIS86_12005 [Streptosporangiaceae bacterium]